MERRIGITQRRRKDGDRMFWPIPLFAGLAIFAAANAHEALGQDSIIINKADSGNKNAVFFQKEKPIIRLRSLEEASGVSENADTPADQGPIPVNIVIPNAPPVAVSRRELSIPFPSISSDPQNPIVSQGLLFSSDQGKSWQEYGPMKSVAEGNDFIFHAPADGEYWFSLRLILQDGTETASRGQKFKIETAVSGTNGANPATPASATPATSATPGAVSGFHPPVPGGVNHESATESAPTENAGGEPANQEAHQNEKMVQGLLSLTKKSETASNIHPTVSSGENTPTPAVAPTKENAASDPLTSRLDELGKETSSGKQIASVPFPGKIDQIEAGTAKSGSPAIQIRWFKPVQIGGEKADGKLRIERSAAPNGPWAPVTEDAVDLDVNGPGYWFEAKEDDSEPFYLRTVSVDQYGQEWIDQLPKPIRFPAWPTKPKAPETNFSNVAAETPAKTEDFPKRSSDEPIKAWDENLTDSASKKGLAADLETKKDEKENNAVVNKTASINQSAPDANRNSLTGNGAGNRGSFERPQLTDPRQISVNPIFNYGLGVFSGKDRSGNRLPSYADQKTPPPPTPGASEEPNIPPPPKRSIFMSQAEYRQLQMEYENAKEQARIAAQQKAQAAVYHPAGPTGGMQATVTDAQGNQVTVTEGSVLYQDEKGNMTTTPFTGAGTGQPMVMGGNVVMPGQTIVGDSGQGMIMDPNMNMTMTFPDQTFGGDFSNVSQSAPLGSDPQVFNQGDSTYLNQNNSLDPYSNRDRTLGADSFTPEPAQAPVLPSTLPPRPQTQNK